MTYLEAWPKHGMMLDGAAFEHLPWVRPTVENGGSASGGWPSHSASVHNYGQSVESHDAKRERLRRKYKNSNGCGKSLSVEVNRWPTPTKTDFKGSSKPGQRRGQLSEALEPNNPGRLNPDWVELLMGFPPGWTSLPQDGLPPLAPHMHGNHQEPAPSNPETKNGCKL